MLMNEWKKFIKIRHIMKKVDHFLMVKCFNECWQGFLDLKVKPSELNEAIHAQDYLRNALQKIKKQAEDCLYYSYSPNGKSKNKDIVNNNSSQLMNILSII